MSLVRKQKKLQKYVRRYFAAHPEVRLIVVSGSVGKTFAKIAIATVLSERYKVRLFHGNRGTNFSAPLSILGIDYPGDIRGWWAWHKVFSAARKRIKQPEEVTVIIHEVNASQPGDIAEYASYVIPDIAVVTAVSTNNMETFQSLDDVAREQMSLVNMSRTALINRDDIDNVYAAALTNNMINTYGTGGLAEYRYDETDYEPHQGYSGNLIVPDWEELTPVKLQIHDEFSVRLAVAAAAVAIKMGVQREAIVKGLENIRPQHGRMNILRGVEDSIIIDDTLTNNPLGVTVAIRTLYQILAPQRIAVFGSMQHLGAMSAVEHQAVGELCDSTRLAWVVVVGDEAAQYIAPIARARGCQVKICKDALEVGTFVHSVIERDSAVLFSGPEDGIYLEEAVKIVLHDESDETKLVRQSPELLEQKDAYFSRF